jgi:hypothetical protein
VFGFDAFDHQFSISTASQFLSIMMQWSGLRMHIILAAVL